jgi:hypothetical protein
MIAGHDDQHRWVNRMAGSTGGDWVCSRCGEYRGARGPGTSRGCPGEVRYPYEPGLPAEQDRTQANVPTTDTIYLKSPTETREPWAGNKPVPEEQEHPRFRKKKPNPKKPKTRGQRKQEQKLQRQLARQHGRRPR